MERTSALPVTAGALLPFGVYATSHLERLGSAPSRRDLSLSVRRRLGHAQPVWAQHPAPWRRTGHDGGAAHLGAEPEPSCARALSDPRRSVDRHRRLTQGKKPLPVPGTGPIPAFSRANGVVAESGGDRR